MHIERQHPQGSGVGVVRVDFEGLFDLIAGGDGSDLGETGSDNLVVVRQSK